MTINTLLVGFGYAAQTFHFPFLQAVNDFTLTAVVSSDANKVHKYAPNVVVFNALQQALKHNTYDLVIITTPNHLHEQQCEQALLAGCNVLVEKPFTLSRASAQRLVELAKTQQRKLCVFHNRRFDGDFLTIKQLLASERLGSLKRMESRFDRFRPIPRNRWRENAGPGSGIFWDLAPHLIDQSLQLFGMPQNVRASINILRPNGKADDIFDIELNYKTHHVLLGSSPFEAGPTLRFALQGTNASFRKYHLDPQEAQLKAGMSFKDPMWATTPTTQHGLLYHPTEPSTNPADELLSKQATSTVTTCKGDYMGFYTQLAKALRTHANEPLPADAASVVAVLTVMEMAIDAAKH